MSRHALSLCAFAGAGPRKRMDQCPLEISENAAALCPCKHANATCHYPNASDGTRINYPKQLGQLLVQQAKQREWQQMQHQMQQTQLQTLSPKEISAMTATTPASTTPATPAPGASTPATGPTPAPASTPTLFASPDAPLFPRPIPVIGVTGEANSGKTCFGLMIDPPRTLMYDLEKSGESYSWLPFTRVDVPIEMNKIVAASPAKYPDKTYRPIDLFTWWRDHILSIQPGQYRVIMLDPAEKIEAGLSDWVKANPSYFGKTAAQFAAKNGAIMHGAIAQYWTQLLTDISTRCETFVFTVHLADEYSGDNKTGRRKPKGKTALLEMASLYLWLERKPDIHKNVPKKPSGIVIKQRINHGRYDAATGEIIMQPAMPPRLPEATPQAIRWYMLNPPDYEKLKAEEQAPEFKVEEADLEAMRLSRAEAERDTAALQLERERTAAARAAGNRQQVQQAAAPAATPPPARTQQLDPTAQQPIAPGRLTHHQLRDLAQLRERLFERTAAGKSDADKAAIWQSILSKRNVTTAKDLTPEQATELAVAMRSMIHRVDQATATEAFPPPSPSANGSHASNGDASSDATGQHQEGTPDAGAAFPAGSGAAS